MTDVTETSGGESVFPAQETLLLLGGTLGALALVLLGVAVALILLKRRPLGPVKGRSTRVEV